MKEWKLFMGGKKVTVVVVGGEWGLNVFKFIREKLKIPLEQWNSRLRSRNFVQEQNPRKSF